VTGIAKSTKTSGLELFHPDREGYHLPISDRPGLGIELNREALKRCGF
jgi:hypothetical protein